MRRWQAAEIAAAVRNATPSRPRMVARDAAHSARSGWRHLGFGPGRRAVPTLTAFAPQARGTDHKLRRQPHPGAAGVRTRLGSPRRVRLSSVSMRDTLDPHRLSRFTDDNTCHRSRRGSSGLHPRSWVRSEHRTHEQIKERLPGSRPPSWCRPPSACSWCPSIWQFAAIREGPDGRALACHLFYSASPGGR